MRSFPYTQVDVFTDVPLRGNPLAVVHGADGVSDEQMQDFARWTNLSETTFLLQPTTAEGDYRVRIFTPNGELAFAGHPTLGSCHAWLERGGRPKAAAQVVQECGVGLVRLRLDDTRAAFAAPALRNDPVDDGMLRSVLAALGLNATQVRSARRLDNGTVWVALLLEDAATVLGIEPDHVALKTLVKVGVVAPHPPGASCQFELRGFAACNGVPEDPVTGSLNAGVAQWLIGEGIAPARYVASQGARLGREGRVYVERDGDTVWIGGHSISCIRGEVAL